jgi:hypothetical protein
VGSYLAIQSGRIIDLAFTKLVQSKSESAGRPFFKKNRPPQAWQSPHYFGNACLLPPSELGNPPVAAVAACP